MGQLGQLGQLDHVDVVKWLFSEINKLVVPMVGDSLVVIGEHEP